MTDELTPEEREALKHLPRERMPSAGLEDRVVGAMRGRGILSTKQPGRIVRITTSRVAGLLAACLVLMIGAYSIGLHRGGDNEVLRSVQSPVRDEPATEVRELTMPAPELDATKRAREPESPATRSVPMKTNETAQLADDTRRAESRLKDSDTGEDEPASAPAEGLAAGRTDEKAAASLKREIQPPAPSTAKMYATDAVAPQSLTAPGQRQRAFNLGGTAFIVDAPDSVRIVQDPEGRMLLIYTSDGIIRIRLAD